MTICVNVIPLLLMLQANKLEHLSLASLPNNTLGFKGWSGTNTRLLVGSLSNEEKSFITMTICVNVIPLLLMLQANKLEHLSLVSLPSNRLDCKGLSRTNTRLFAWSLSNEEKSFITLNIWCQCYTFVTDAPGK